MEKNYQYAGPPTGVTLPDGREALLWPGAAVVLPEDNDYVKTLVELGRLTVSEKKSSAPRAEKKEAPNAG